jgi:hypothetical protein
MMKSGIDQDALIQMFSGASAKQSEQVRKTVYDATLGALQGRELTLKNIRGVLGTVTQAASAGAAKNLASPVDVEKLLDDAVAGMDAALLKAVDANRVALQQFVSQGADLRDKHLKKALSDLEKMEDSLVAAIDKAAGGAGEQMAGLWAGVLDKINIQGTQSGAQATDAAKQFTQQMQSAVRDSRAAGMKAAQALAESYTALVSGVLIGMSDALRQATPPAAPAKKK